MNPVVPIILIVYTNLVILGCFSVIDMYLHSGSILDILIFYRFWIELFWCAICNSRAS